MAPTSSRRALLTRRWRRIASKLFTELAVAIHIGDAASLELRADLLHADQHPGEPHLRQTAGALERDHDDLVDFAVPALLRPAAEVPAANQAGLVVVRPEVGRAGMGDLEGDERDLRIAVFRRDRCRDVFVGLELDDEVDLLTDQDLGVALRDFRAVPVVDADELHAVWRRRAAGRPRRPSRTGSRCPGPHTRAGRASA